MMGIVDSNGKPIKHPELTEEELKQIAESLDEKYGPLSIESTLNFFEFVDMWKRNFGELLDKTPEVGHAKIVHGEWIEKGYGGIVTYCSECLHRAPINNRQELMLSNYCPNCGAKMDGGKE